ncbi:MAG: PAS domain S-box protein [Leptolyngbya sp.]|nr:PAS domain S-box protein [Candidatus Melainabacteria bacterium]
MSQSLLLELLDGRNVLLDAVGSAKNRLSARTDVLSAREETERKLITKLNTMLIIALLLSLILTLGLCFLFSKVIIDRVSVLRKNTQRLSEGVLLLPSLQGSDEIAKLDASFRSMEQAITAGKIRDEQILSNSIDAICALDQNLHVRRASESCKTLWNLDNQNVVGQSILDFVPDSSRDSIKDYFNVAVGASGAKVFENECISGVNKMVPCLWSVQWSDKDELFICVIHDITERKLAEDRRQTLLAVISHDLRSPLTAAKLCIDMLRIEEKPDSDINTKLRGADDSIDYVIGVTNDLIDLCRFQQAKLSLKLKLSTLDSVLNSISTTFHKQRFLLLIQNDVEESCYVTIDEEYISRLFMALAKQVTLHFEPQAVKLTITKDTQENIVFAFEPWLEKVAPKEVEPFDSKKKTSFDVTMTFCREIVSNLKGEIIEAGHHKFELHLPNVAVE